MIRFFRKLFQKRDPLEQATRDIETLKAQVCFLAHEFIELRKDLGG